MQRSPPTAGLVLCWAAVSLSACASDKAPPTAQSAFPPKTPGVSLATAAPACQPKTHPNGVIDNIATPPAFGIAVRDDGLTYFTELFNGGVGITSTQTRTVNGFIPTGSVPTGLDFAPDGNTAYVTNQGSQNVGVIDVTSAQQVATIFTPAGNPLVVRVSPDGSRLFIATASTTVYIVDTQSRQIIGSVQVGFVPNAFAVHPDGRILYVSAALGGSVTEVDMFTGTVLRTFTVGGIPQDMAVSHDGQRLYVANESAAVLDEITLQAGQITAAIPLAGGPFGIGVTPDDNHAYVSIPSAGLVQVFNLQSRKIAFQLNVGGKPRRIGFSQQGSIGAIANEAGSVTFVR
jgi:YVTN family beta-propeller protein